jgi:hypothetical protein
VPFYPSCFAVFVCNAFAVARARAVVPNDRNAAIKNAAMAITNDVVGREGEIGQTKARPGM